MKVDIICPLYNAASYVVKQYNAIKAQICDADIDIHYILTESTDDTEEVLLNNEISFKKIKKEEFSHSKTREDIAMACDGDILVFITQDVVINRNDWLNNLIKPIVAGDCVASFSRQVSIYKGIEKYTREKNYPEESYINCKEDLQKKGLKTFFFSDASSAIKTSVFKELNGYDGKILPTNEDMYIAYKIIMAGYKIKYCSDSVVEHSHKFTLKQVYNRYYLTGLFMAQNSYLDKYGTTKTGGGLAKYILKRAIKSFDVKTLFRFFPDMFARWLGFKKGKNKFNKKELES